MRNRMRLLKRNCIDVQYYPYVGETGGTDEYGRDTGDFEPEYGTPVDLKRVNISTPSGLANQMFYGMDIQYTNVMLIDDPDPEINEYGRIVANGVTYEIRAVRRSLNLTSVALREVMRDHSED